MILGGGNDLGDQIVISRRGSLFAVAISLPVHSQPADGWSSEALERRATIMFVLPSGKRLHNYGKSSFLMGKLTISTGPYSIANC